MSLKKNAFSYAIWMIMLLFTGGTVAFFGMVLARFLAGDNIFVAVAIVAGFFIILFLLYLLTGFLVNRIHPQAAIEKNEKLFLFVEGLCIGLCLSAGVAIRVFLLPYAGEDASYYELAKVTENGSTIVQSVQGSVYYYCMLLHGLFRIFGNHWIVGIWLQIVLQAMAGLLFYFAIRRMTGIWPAILTLVFMNFAPLSINAGLHYSPQMLYFCIFALVFLLIADYMNRSAKEERHLIGMWIYTVLVGMGIGFACYVDVSGIILILPACCICMVRRPTGRAVLWFLRFLLLVISGVGTFMGIIFLDALLSGSAFIRVLNAWFVTYSTIDLNVKILMEEKQMELLLLLILVFIGVFSFWRRKNEENFSPYVLLVIGISVLYFAGITAKNMDGSYLLYMLLAALAGVTVSELFYKEQAKVVKKTMIEAADVEVSMEKTIEKKVEIIDLEKNEQTKEENKMIENPLPVPKKKVRKAMDYAYIPRTSEMVYDIQVSDKDDFDI